MKADYKNLEEGESIFHNSIHDYYQDRPKNSKDDDVDWEEMTLADFVANYNVHKTKPASKNAIPLQNKRGYIIQRNNECVIRYFLKYEHEIEYYRALCILFHPFRDERKDIHMKDVQALYKENEESIEIIRSHFEQHRDIVDMMRERNEKQDKVDDEESEDEFIDDETTTVDELEDFQNFFQNQAKQQLYKYNEGKEEMSEDDYLSKIESLNKEQRKIFDDFVERINDPTDEEPFYLYIGGEAGTGKSFLLKLFIEAVNRLQKYSGQELDKPYYITIAPTGVAAYIVNGSTIESALGINANNRRKSYTSNTASRNSNLSFLYENLKVIFLDEVSMCGTDKLTMINFRMQEIMGNSKFMGGVALVCTGDFGQLPPVKDRIIWEKSYLDGRNDLAPNHWNENFSIYYLTEKMRSQDEEFSKISDKVRKGVCDSDVLKFMKDHVRDCPTENENNDYKHGKLAIIVTTNKDRDLINHDKLNKLLPLGQKYHESCVDESTNTKNGPKVPEHLPHTQTGQLETNFIFKQDAPVMITSNHPQQRYKNNGIVNGSRGYIDSIQVSKDNTNEVEIIWVRFNDDKTGQLLRQDNQALLKHHKPNDPKAVPIRKQKKPFQPMGGNSSVVRTQFPLTLCYALTAYKCQGQTLKRVIVDFTGARKNDAGSFYTAMSRVRNGESLYLRDFKPEYITANELVERQIKSMKISVPYTFKKFYLDVNIFEKPDNEVKVGYVNINCLYHSRSDIFLNNDDNLLCLDYLAVADTRLTKNHSNFPLQERQHVEFVELINRQKHPKPIHS